MLLSTLTLETSYALASSLTLSTTFETINNKVLQKEDELNFNQKNNYLKEATDQRFYEWSVASF